MIDAIETVWKRTPYCDLLRQVHREGKSDFIPILTDDTALSLATVLEDRQPQRILEIGTAIGYSGLLMLGLTQAELVTIDMDGDRLERAIEHFEQAGVRDRVRVIHDDALSVLPMMDMTFDFVLLDGPKARYSDMIEDIVRVLVSGGCVFVDDVDYLGLVQGDAKVIHKHRTIVNNMRSFVERVGSDARLDCTRLNGGNALLIQKRN